MDFLLALPCCSGAVHSRCGFLLPFLMLFAVFFGLSAPQHPRLQDECLEYGLFTVSVSLLRGRLLPVCVFVIFSHAACCFFGFFALSAPPVTG